MNRIRLIAIVSVLSLVISGCVPQSDGSKNFSLVSGATPAPTISGGTATPPPVATATPTATPTPTPAPSVQNLLTPCTMINSASSFQFYPYAPRDTAIPLYDCPSGTVVSFSGNGKLQNQAFETVVISSNKVRIQIRSGYFWVSGVFGVGIAIVSNGASYNTTVQLQVYDRLVKKDSLFFDKVSQCHYNGATCDQGTLFELAPGNWKCRYSEDNITRIKGAYYSNGNSHLYYMPDYGSTSCDQGGYFMSGNGNPLPNRCVIENSISGTYYVLTLTNHNNFWKAPTVGPKSGNLKVMCPFGSMPDITTYNATANTYSCKLWSIPSGDGSFIYKSGSKLYQSLPASGTCPVSSALDSGACLIADFSGSTWQIDISADSRHATVRAKNVSCQ